VRPMAEASSWTNLAHDLGLEEVRVAILETVV
jgi:hypothetical protein